MNPLHDGPAATSDAEVYAALLAFRLAADQPNSAVSDVFRQSRELHPRLGLRGALVFDGVWFMQLHAGPRLRVLRRTELIAADGRLTEHAALFQGALPVADAGPDVWRCGWAPADALAPGRWAAATPALFEQFRALLPDCDLL